MQKFNRWPRTEEPSHWTGKAFAERYPDHSPYSFGSWNSREGPKLTPDLTAADVHDVLDDVEAQVMEADADLARFVQAPPPSPWGEGWWPVPEEFNPA